MWILHILVMLLKLIGILLLVLLLLLLTAVLLVLFAAVRYRVQLTAESKEAEKIALADTLYVRALVTWLNPLVRVNILAEGKKFTYQVRLFGICLFDSNKPKKEKKPVSKQKGKPEKKPVTKESVLLKETGQQAEVRKQEGPVRKEDTSAGDRQKEAEQGKGKTEKEPPKDEPQKKTIWDKIKELCERLAERFHKIKDGLQKLKEKKELLGAYLQAEENKHAWGLCFRTVKKLLRHLLPLKLRGEVVYGSGDPASTGQTFAILGILYAKYGEAFNVTPDFEEKRLSISLKAKGRIRLGTLLGRVGGLLCKKEIRAFYKRTKTMLEQLKQST